MKKYQVKKLSLHAETLRVLDRTCMKEVVGAVSANTLCAACPTGTCVCSGCTPCA